MATNREINEQQKEFVYEFLKNGYNAKQAAIAAGYSERSAEVAASRLLKNDKVIEFKEKLLKDLESPKIATIEEILEYYTRVMRREEKESVVVTIKEKTSGWVTNRDTGKREKVTKETETAQIVEIPTKVSDANKAAEMLGKNYGIWTDKMSIDGNTAVTFVDDLKE